MSEPAEGKRRPSSRRGSARGTRPPVVRVPTEQGDVNTLGYARDEYAYGWGESWRRVLGMTPWIPEGRDTFDALVPDRYKQKSLDKMAPVHRVETD